MVHRRSGSQSLYGRLLVRRWCRILVLIIGGDHPTTWPLCNCNKERIASGTFDDSGMQIYASRFAYGTVRRCVNKVGRWYADACEWISKSSQPPQWIHVEWCGEGSLRLESSPYLGYMRLETLLWFIIYDLSCMILFCGYELDSSTKMTCMYVASVGQYTCWLSCAKRNIYNIHAIGIISTKFYTLWLSPESIRVRCWLKDWYWLLYGHGRSTHVGIREGENGHGGLEKRERVVRVRWKGNPTPRVLVRLFIRPLPW